MHSYLSKSKTLILERREYKKFGIEKMLNVLLSLNKTESFITTMDIVFSSFSTTTMENFHWHRLLHKFFSWTNTFSTISCPLTPRHATCILLLVTLVKVTFSVWRRSWRWHIASTRSDVLATLTACYHQLHDLWRQVGTSISLFLFDRFPV